MTLRVQYSIRVGLIEDNTFERLGYEEWINRVQDFVCVGSFDDVEAALPVLQERKPDIVILDYGLPGIKGSAAVRVVKRELSSARVLVVTGIPHNYVVFDALEDRCYLPSSKYSSRLSAIVPLPLVTHGLDFISYRGLTQGVRMRPMRQGGAARRV